VDIASEALALRHLRSVGIVDASDLTRWADAAIESEPHPAVQLLDLSLYASRSDFSPEGALSELGKEANASKAWALFCGALLHVFLASLCADSDVARVLYWEAVYGGQWFGMPEPEMYAFWDDIDLARDGVYGDLNAAKDRLEGFLRRHGEHELPWAVRVLRS